MTQLEMDFTPKREYDYINEKGEKLFHSPRQWKLYDFYKTHDMKGKKRREQQELYEEWLQERGLTFYDKYCYGVLGLDEEVNYTNTGIAREFREDLYSIKYSEVMQKIMTKNGFLTDAKEVEKVVKSNFTNALHELKLAWQLVRKAEKEHQMRITFTDYEKDEIRTIKEMK